VEEVRRGIQMREDAGGISEAGVSTVGAAAALSLSTGEGGLCLVDRRRRIAEVSSVRRSRWTSSSRWLLPPLQRQTRRGRAA
jgi:hypothetical protein